MTITLQFPSPQNSTPQQGAYRSPSPSIVRKDPQCLPTPRALCYKRREQLKTTHDPHKTLTTTNIVRHDLSAVLESPSQECLPPHDPDARFEVVEALVHYNARTETLQIKISQIERIRIDMSPNVTYRNLETTLTESQDTQHPDSTFHSNTTPVNISQEDTDLISVISENPRRSSMIRCGSNPDLSRSVTNEDPHRGCYFAKLFHDTLRNEKVRQKARNLAHLILTTEASELPSAVNKWITE